ncbi:hypothetical protein INT48_003323 [Thamnidium elegans]|uniref:Uncharacterized protein n=1 Tax=Thamnidium elegans TaxID=101142 RepID=A0A8H7SMX1_9FUNG|nr:hypothetical protein INT48_003323 [Thamnidium elegans]
MGLRKLLSSNTTEKDEKKANRRSSSTISLTKSISNWAHKEKTKHHSLNTTSKRYSQPSPTISDASLQFSKKTTNPFEPNQLVTPSGSLGDVNDVVTTLQNSWSEDNYHATIINNPPDAINTEDDTNEKLYAELQEVSLKLNSMDPNNAVEIKKRIYDINNLLVNTMHSSEKLEGRIKQVVDTSKLIIMSASEQNQGLKQSLESHITNSENTHTLALMDLNSQQEVIETKNKALEQDKEQLVRENQILHEAYKTIETELNQLKSNYQDLKDARTELYNLVQVVNDKELTKQIKTMMMTIQDMMMATQNKERDIVANQTQEQNNALIIEALQADKIKLEYGTAEIRDLMDKEHDRLVAQIEALTSERDKKTLELEFKLTEIKARHKQSIETHEKTRLENEALKQQLVDMEIASKASAKLVMRENKLLEERIQETLNEPEEIMQLHTKAQLGLIEYLEGQEDVIQAMAKFKKQLETNMSEFNSTNTILSVASS